MPDPVTLITTVGVVSMFVSSGGFVKAARAHFEQVQAVKPPIGAALDAAFGCGDEIPPDFADLLAKLD